MQQLRRIEWRLTLRGLQSRQVAVPGFHPEQFLDESPE